MKTISKDELNEILDKHGQWLRKEDEGERADLSYANLCSANLSYADLRYADLRSADLRYANLSYADLRYADLRYADLRYADLTDANGVYPYKWLIAPQCGAFIGWKKVRGAVLKLSIPEDARRVNAPGARKLRVDKATVLEAVGSSKTEFVSLYNDTFRYVVGHAAEEKDFDESPYIECAKGIHLFLTNEEAEEFSL